MSLSAYELEREKTIAANNAVLKSLGLDQVKLAPKQSKKTPAKRARNEDPDFVPEPRRTTRVSDSRRLTRAKTADVSDDESGDDEDDEYDDIPRPVKASNKRAPAAAAAPATATASVPPPEEATAKGACIVIEAAKTGRSKCRRCLEMLAIGAPRVGMESWMVGRQVMTWQHPTCFASGLEVTVEATGRGKCKQTKKTFSAGERRLSATAHTTTAHFSLAAAGALLRPVFASLPEADRHAAADAIRHRDLLEVAEATALDVALLCAAAQSDAASALAEGAVGETPSTEDVLLAVQAEAGHADAEGAPSERAAAAAARQPPKGRASKSTGKVCWRFGGHLCYGTLLPAQETKERCFARTHKGNTKVLTKGLASWWLLE